MGTLLEVDYRERTSALFPMVAACSDFDVHVGRLLAGDYIVGREVVIERKTAADFVASVIDARIFRQAQRLALARLRPLLIVEGEPETGLHPHAWLGSMLSVTVRWRVPVIRCGNPNESLTRAASDRSGRREQHRGGRHESHRGRARPSRWRMKTRALNPAGGAVRVPEGLARLPRDCHPTLPSTRGSERNRLATRTALTSVNTQPAGRLAAARGPWWETWSWSRRPRS